MPDVFVTSLQLPLVEAGKLMYWYCVVKKEGTESSKVRIAADKLQLRLG